MANAFLASLDGRFHALALGDVRADRNEHGGFAAFIRKRNDGGVKPTQVA